MVKNKYLLRVIALLIDTTFVTFIASQFKSIFNGHLAPIDIINLSFELPFLLLYFFVFDYRNNGETLGKVMVNIIMPKITLRLKLVRSVLKTISIIFLPVTVIFYLYKKEILHDYILKNKFIHKPFH